MKVTFSSLFSAKEALSRFALPMLTHWPSTTMVLARRISAMHSAAAVTRA